MLLLDMAYRLLREFRQASTRLDTPPFSNRRHPGSDIAHDRTQLPDRLMFQQRISEADDASETGKSCALLYLDLDRFKQANDTGRHVIGDELLTAVAHCLSPTAWTSRLPKACCWATPAWCWPP